MVIVLILCMLFLLPVFQIETYITSKTSFEVGIGSLMTLKDTWYNVDSEVFYVGYNSYIEEHSKLTTPLIRLTLPGLEIWKKGRPIKEYRLDEIETVVGLEKSVAVYDVRVRTQAEGIISISRTFFICILLTLASIYFNKDANELVLIPIERMIEKVKMIAKNPMIAASD
jgi:hypothetical protein